ncbi:MAG: zinc ribbon domain-containing protein [Candidatus Pacearchaeota archaeon]
MTSNRDLRQFQKEGAIDDAFAKLVSGGKVGFKTILEKRESIYCPNNACKRELEPHQKFCPSCGTNIEKKPKAFICTKCYNIINLGDKFCGSCGTPVEQG